MGGKKYNEYGTPNEKKRDLYDVLKDFALPIILALITAGTVTVIFAPEFTQTIIFGDNPQNTGSGGEVISSPDAPTATPIIPTNTTVPTATPDNNQETCTQELLSTGTPTLEITVNLGEFYVITTGDIIYVEVEGNNIPLPEEENRGYTTAFTTSSNEPITYFLSNLHPSYYWFAKYSGCSQSDISEVLNQQAFNLMNLRNCDSVNGCDSALITTFEGAEMRTELRTP